MQSMKLSMTTARFEAASYSKTSQKRGTDSTFVIPASKQGSRHVNNGASSALYGASARLESKSFSLSSYLYGQTSEGNLGSYKEFRMKIQSMSMETFTGQEGEFSSFSGRVSVSYTSIEITVGGNDGAVDNAYDRVFGEDAYWGSEKTSQRLFDFVKSLAGNDRPTGLYHSRA